MPHRILLAFLPLLSVAAGCSALASLVPIRPPRPAATILHSESGRLIDLQELVAAVAGADVVFFGEEHDDSITHAVQLAVLEALAERGERVALALEMFERDVQPVLDEYLRGDIEEAEFLDRARPWRTYATDYRPLVEAAHRHQWEVLATNLPQRLAALVAQQGISALDTLPAEERPLAASAHECPTDAYWDRFVEALVTQPDSAAHPLASADDPMLRRMFEAQCARDEAMAETIAENAGEHTLVLHMNGRFHSDYRLGIVPRLARRRPELDIRVIAAVPVTNPLRPDIDEHREKGDYVVFTKRGYPLSVTATEAEPCRDSGESRNHGLGRVTGYGSDARISNG